jgi:hypothetical protein
LPLTAVDNYLPKVAEHFWETLIGLEQLILSLSPQVEERTSYGTPFFYYDRKMFCYLTVIKGEDCVTLGICNGAFLADPAGLLAAGEGKKMIRHLKVPDSAFAPEPIAELLRTSMARLDTVYQMRTRK